MSNPQLSKPTPIGNDPVGSLVGEFLDEKKKERAEEKARQAPRKRNPFVLPFLIAVVLAIWIGPSLMAPPEPVLTVETMEHGARVTVYLASLRVREYRAKHQRLPLTLTEAGVDSTGLLYSRSSESVFELSTRVQGTKLTYRSTMPDSVFLAGTGLRGIS
jgi:hypothetical protein